MLFAHRREHARKLRVEAGVTRRGLRRDRIDGLGAVPTQRNPLSGEMPVNQIRRVTPRSHGGGVGVRAARCTGAVW